MIIKILDNYYTDIEFIPVVENSFLYITATMLYPNNITCLRIKLKSFESLYKMDIQKRYYKGVGFPVYRSADVYLYDEDFCLGIIKNPIIAPKQKFISLDVIGEFKLKDL